MTASGVLRGWVSNSVLRRGHEADLAAAPPAPDDAVTGNAGAVDTAGR